MSTNRPFFSSFLSAFRGSTSPTGAVSGASLTSAYAAAQAAQQQAREQQHAAQQYHTSTQSTTQQSSTTTATASSPTARQAPTKSLQPSTTVSQSTPPTTIPGTTTSSSTHHHHTRSFQPSRQHSASPYSRSPGSPPFGSASRNHSHSRDRRGSDSSNEGGFRDALGAEKWYVGGRTAAGDERFYKLSMVKRPRSLDRLSLDRMSM